MPLTRTQPKEDILCRHPGEDAELTKALALYTEGLDEFVDFGTHILDWEFRKEDLREESIPIISLFRRILELTDAISILLKSHVADPCEILLRTLFETTLSLEYILKTDTDRRALCYLFTVYAERLTFLKRHDPNDSNYKQYQKDYKHGRVYKDVPKISNLEGKIAAADEWIERPEHTEVKNEYVRVKQIKKKVKGWFTPFSDLTNQDEEGKPKFLESIQDLAKHLGKFDLYETLYRSWSRSVHATDVITGNFLGKDSSVAMVALRQPVQAHAVANLTIRLLEDVLFNVHRFNERRKNEQYREMIGKIIWWIKAYNLNYTKPIIERNINFEDL
ncbi:DUF5677 domain-containing protein [Spirosoma areae]